MKNKFFKTITLLCTLSVIGSIIQCSKSERITPLESSLSADDSELESRVSIPILDTLAIGLIGHYKFDGNAKDSRHHLPDIVFEKSGYKTATPVYTTNRLGQTNKAIRFTGTYKGDLSSFLLDSISSSISVWIKPEKSLYDSQVYSTSDRLIFDGGFHFFSFNQIQSSPTIQCSFGYKDKSSKLLNTQWQHLAMTYNGKILTYYFDGILNASFQDFQSFSPAAIHLVLSSYLNLNLWVGSMDELRIYNKELSQGAVTALYNLNN